MNPSISAFKQITGVLTRLSSGDFKNSKSSASQRNIHVNQGMSAERLSRGIHELQGSSTYLDIFLRESLTVEQPFCVETKSGLKACAAGGSCPEGPQVEH